MLSLGEAGGPLRASPVGCRDRTAEGRAPSRMAGFELATGSPSDAMSSWQSLRSRLPQTAPLTALAAQEALGAKGSDSQAVPPMGVLIPGAGPQTFSVYLGLATASFNPRV